MSLLSPARVKIHQTIIWDPVWSNRIATGSELCSELLRIFGQSEARRGVVGDAAGHVAACTRV